MNNQTTSSFTTGKRNVTKRKVSIKEASPQEQELQFTTRYVDAENRKIISPITFSYTGKGEKHIRPRTLADEMSAKALQRGSRPTRRAIKMANALELEYELERGAWSKCSGKSLRKFAERVGISRNTLSELLNMLNRPVKDIEAILFETD